MLSQKDRDVLRGLAARIAEIAALPAVDPDVWKRVSAGLIRDPVFAQEP